VCGTTQNIFRRSSLWRHNHVRWWWWRHTEDFCVTNAYRGYGGGLFYVNEWESPKKRGTLFQIIESHISLRSDLFRCRRSETLFIYLFDLRKKKTFNNDLIWCHIFYIKKETFHKNNAFLWKQKVWHPIWWFRSLEAKELTREFRRVYSWTLNLSNKVFFIQDIDSKSLDKFLQSSDLNRPQFFPVRFFVWNNSKLFQILEQ